jgi:hypothetical protein
MCDGSGKQFDPGREYSYIMGPVSLNSPGAVSSTLSNGPTLQAVPTQVVNYPFRWMFSICDSTFPFTIQLKDSGSGGQRPFSNAQIVSLNLFGTGQRPLPLPTPFVFPKNQNITADFTDLYGAAGVANVTSGSAAVTWSSGALFSTGVNPGPPFPGAPAWNNQTINLAGVNYVISAVTSQTTLTLATNYLGGTAAVAYYVPNVITVTFKGVELSS